MHLRLEKVFNLPNNEAIEIVADHIPKEAKYHQNSFTLHFSSTYSFCLYFKTILELSNKNGSKLGLSCAKVGDRVDTKNFKIRK